MSRSSQSPPRVSEVTSPGAASCEQERSHCLVVVTTMAGKELKLNADPLQRVREIKEEVAKQLRIPIPCLLFDSTLALDEDVLAQHGAESDSLLHACLIVTVDNVCQSLSSLDQETRKAAQATLRDFVRYAGSEVNHCLQHENYTARLKTLQYFGECDVGNEHAIDAAISSLKDEHWRVREVALEVLEKVATIRDQRSIDAASALTEDAEAPVRIKARQVLEKYERRKYQVVPRRR